MRWPDASPRDRGGFTASGCTRLPQKAGGHARGVGGTGWPRPTTEAARCITIYGRRSPPLGITPNVAWGVTPPACSSSAKLPGSAAQKVPNVYGAIHAHLAFPRLRRKMNPDELTRYRTDPSSLRIVAGKLAATCTAPLATTTNQSPEVGRICGFRTLLDSCSAKGSTGTFAGLSPYMCRVTPANAGGPLHPSESNSGNACANCSSPQRH